MQIYTLPRIDADDYFCGLVSVMDDPRTGEPLLPRNAVRAEAPCSDPSRDGNFYKWDGSKFVAEPKPASAADCAAIGKLPHESQTTRVNELRQLFRKFTESSSGYRLAQDPDSLALHVEKIPEPTPEEQAAQELAEAKSERATAVSKLVVTVDSMTFDADEESQSRMSRTIAAAVALGADLATEKRTWVLADNSIAEPTVKQLAEALRLAGDAQTKLWTVPYEEQDKETKTDV